MRRKQCTHKHLSWVGQLNTAGQVTQQEEPSNGDDSQEDDWRPSAVGGEKKSTNHHHEVCLFLSFCMVLV